MTNAKLAIALFVGITISLPVAAKLYKWVDDQGVTHYGETIPPEYADKDRIELDKSGHAVKKEIASPDERRAKAKNEAKKEADEKAALEQKRRDLTLMNTYSSAEEVDLARTRNLQQLNALIVNNTSQLKMANEHLSGLHSEAEDYTKAGKAMPASLQEEMQHSQARIDKLKVILEKSLAEKAEVEARYDADKKRYQELTGR